MLFLLDNLLHFFTTKWLQGRLGCLKKDYGIYSVSFLAITAPVATRKIEKDASCLKIDRHKLSPMAPLPRKDIKSPATVTEDCRIPTVSEII